MKNLFRIFLGISAAFLIAGCGFAKSKEAAVKGVEAFHQEFNDSKFREVYAAATPAFKSASTEPDFLKFMEAVRRKLGAYKGGTQQGWRTNVFNGKTSVELSYKSDFEKGSAVETFTYSVSGGGATLQGYNVTSPKLVTE